MATRKTNTANEGRVKRPFVWAPNGRLYQKGQLFEGTPENVASLIERGYLEGAKAAKKPAPAKEPEPAPEPAPEPEPEAAPEPEPEADGVTLDDIKPKRTRSRAKKAEPADE